MPQWCLIHRPRLDNSEVPAVDYGRKGWHTLSKLAVMTYTTFATFDTNAEMPPTVDGSPGLRYPPVL